MNVMMMDKTDRLVYMETFREGEEAHGLGYTEKFNPYKQGTVSQMGWDEGWEYAKDSA